ncbi:MAG: heat shock protein transcriptional repressor HspR, partial [Pseudonocardiaceae bacterium]
GVNLAGVKRIIDLENQVEALRSRLVELATELDEARTQLAAAHSVAEQAAAAVHASYRRDLVPVRPPDEAALVVWRPPSRRR